MDQFNFARLADAANERESAFLTCPPGNIEVIGDNAYRLTRAMAPPEDYRRKAEEFRKQAASVQDGALRQAYLDIADEYERLAMEVEKAQRGNEGGSISN